MPKQEPELNLELHGAARASMLCDYFKYFYQDDETPDRLKCFALKEALAKPGEHSVDFADLEEQADLPGELIDPEDFTFQFDEIDIPSRTVYLDKQVIDYAIQQYKMDRNDILSRLQTARRP
jgi:hypothetical protein